MFIFTSNTAVLSQQHKLVYVQWRIYGGALGLKHLPERTKQIIFVLQKGIYLVAKYGASFQYNVALKFIQMLVSLLDLLLTHLVKSSSHNWATYL